MNKNETDNDGNTNHNHGNAHYNNVQINEINTKQAKHRNTTTQREEEMSPNTQTLCETGRQDPGNTVKGNRGYR